MGDRRSRDSAFVPRMKRARSCFASNSAQSPSRSTALAVTPMDMRCAIIAGTVAVEASAPELSASSSKLVASLSSFTSPANSAVASDSVTSGPIATSRSPSTTTRSACRIASAERPSYLKRHFESTATAISPVIALSRSTASGRKTMSE